jgi:hypothetical protein
MGLVFRAEDPLLCRQVALKTLHPALATSAAARERFLREARAAAAVLHHHVVTIHQVGEDRGVPYLAMQLLEGESLEQRLSSGGAPFEIADAVRIAREVAEGLAAAHGRGVIHRDVKPANIWLERDGPGEPGRVKLLDFGLAWVAGEASTLTAPDVLAGTPACVAPERLRGEVADERSDLFGLGCVLYRMLTSEDPFRRCDKLATIMAVAGSTPLSPRMVNPKVPAALADLVMRLLEKEPARRPSSAKQVSAELAVLESWGHAPPAPRRRRWRRAVVVGLLGVAAAAAALLNRPQGPIEAPPQVTQAPLETAAERWTRETAALPGPQQLEAVKARLVELNPGFNGVIGPRFEADRLVEFHFLTDHVTDISPVRALPHMRMLVCRGSGAGKGRLRDLSPLRGLPLELLDCSCNVSLVDLEPLRGMPLQELICWCTPVDNLWPLQGMPLRTLDCNGCYVSDLSPLKGLPLARLTVQVNTSPPGLQPVAGAPLQEIVCHLQPDRDVPILRAIPTLRRINDRPAADVWKEFDEHSLVN